MTCVIHCYAVLAIVSNSYPPLQGRLPTRYSPVRNSSKKSKLLSSAFYLHVLGTPPAFVLSQDQTLMKKFHKSTWLISLLACFLPSLSAAELLVVHQVSSMTLTFLVCLCLVFNVLAVTTWQLLYISTSLTSCQQLFRSFFEVFGQCLLLVATHISYQSRLCLSITF